MDPTGQLLDVMDYISNSFLMPFISLLTSILIGWVIGPDWIIGEVERNGEHFKRAGSISLYDPLCSAGCNADPVPGIYRICRFDFINVVICLWRLDSRING